MILNKVAKDPTTSILMLSDAFRCLTALCVCVCVCVCCISTLYLYADIIKGYTESIQFHIWHAGIFLRICAFHKLGAP